MQRYWNKRIRKETSTKSVVITERTPYGDLWEKGDWPQKRWERQKEGSVWRQRSGSGGNSLLGDLKAMKVNSVYSVLKVLKWRTKTSTMKSWHQLSRKAS